MEPEEPRWKQKLAAAEESRRISKELAKSEGGMLVNVRLSDAELWQELRLAAVGYVALLDACKALGPVSAVQGETQAGPISVLTDAEVEAVCCSGARFVVQLAKELEKEQKSEGGSTGQANPEAAASGPVSENDEKKPTEKAEEDDEESSSTEELDYRAYERRRAAQAEAEARRLEEELGEDEAEKEDGDVSSSGEESNERGNDSDPAELVLTPPGLRRVVSIDQLTNLAGEEPVRTRESASPSKSPPRSPPLGHSRSQGPPPVLAQAHSAQPHAHERQLKSPSAGRKGLSASVMSPSTHSHSQKSPHFARSPSAPTVNANANNLGKSSSTGSIGRSPSRSKISKSPSGQSLDRSPEEREATLLSPRLGREPEGSERRGLEPMRYLSVAKYPTMRARKHRHRQEPEAELAAVGAHLAGLLAAPDPSFLLYYPYLLSGRALLGLLEQAFESAAGAARLRVVNLLVKWVDNPNVRLSPAVLGRLKTLVETLLLPSEHERWARQLRRLIERREGAGGPLRTAQIVAALQEAPGRGGATERGELGRAAALAWFQANLGMDAGSGGALLLDLAAAGWLEGGPATWHWASKAETVRPRAVERRLSRDTFRWSVLTIPPDALAAQTCLIEHALLSELPLWELIERRKSSALALHRLTGWFNETAAWVASEVLSAAPPHKMIRRFLVLAEAFLRARNFNSFLAVVTGLNNSYVARLRPIWAKLGKRYKALHQHLRSQTDSNFRFLREAQASAPSSPTIPCFATLLSDMNHLEALPTFNSEGQINTLKMNQITAVFRELQEYQRTPFPYSPDLQLQHWINDRVVLEEATLKARSLGLLPLRETKPDKPE